MASTEATHIDSTLTESRKFPPPPEFSARRGSKISTNTRRSANARKRTPTRSGPNAARNLHWFKPFGKTLEWNFPNREMVRRRHDQRSVQLPRPPSRRAAPQQGRADLGGRARRLARADLPDARRRSRAMRQRAQEPRRQGRRPRRDLHADGAGGGDRDARVRANRRDSFGRLRRLLVGGAGRPDQRRRGEGLYHRGRRMAARAGGRAQAECRRGAEEVPVDREMRRRAQARRQQGRDAQRARRLVARAGPRAEPEVRSRAARQRASAVHALHQRHHRQAEGRGAYDRRIPDPRAR